MAQEAISQGKAGPRRRCGPRGAFTPLLMALENALIPVSAPILKQPWSFIRTLSYLGQPHAAGAFPDVAGHRGP